jgi:hypothetical protein
MDIEDDPLPNLDFSDWTEENFRKAGIEVERAKYACAALQRHLDKGGADTAAERWRIFTEAMASFESGAAIPFSSLTDPGDKLN